MPAYSQKKLDIEGAIIVGNSEDPLDAEALADRVG